MVAPHAQAKWELYRRFGNALDSFSNPLTRGLHLSIARGHLMVDTLWGDGILTNPLWRSYFKVKAADREQAFKEHITPLVKTKLMNDLAIHDEIWDAVDIEACIHYMTGEVEIVRFQMHSAAATRLDRYPIQWDLTPA